MSAFLHFLTKIYYSKSKQKNIIMLSLCVIIQFNETILSKILFAVPILSFAQIFSTRMNGYYAKKRANVK